MNAKIPPGLSQRRTMPRNSSSRARGHVAQPEPGEERVDRPVRLGPRVAHVQVRPQAMRDQALPRPIERGRCPVVERQLALVGEQRRPPAGAGGELDDLAVDRQGVQPAPGRIELGVPGGVVDGAALVSAAAQVPVVVFRGARLVVGEHLGVGWVVSAGPLRRRAARAAASAGAAADVRHPRSRPRPARTCAPARHGPAREQPPRRRARSAPGAGGTGGSRCRRPCPRTIEQSCAQPSRSSGPRHVYASPHHRQAKVARNGIYAARRGRLVHGVRDHGSTGVHDPNGATSTKASGSKISARSSMPSMTRGPGRLK